MIISKDAKIIVNGGYVLLKIDNRDGETEILASEHNLKYVTCKTIQGELWVNDREQVEVYINILPGNAIIDVFSKRGVIRLNLR